MLGYDPFAECVVISRSARRQQGPEEEGHKEAGPLVKATYIQDLLHSIESSIAKQHPTTLHPNVVKRMAMQVLEYVGIVEIRQDDAEHADVHYIMSTMVKPTPAV